MDTKASYAGDRQPTMVKGLRRFSCVVLTALVAACVSGTTKAVSNHTNSSHDAVAQDALIWSDEFNADAPQSAPNPANWTYDVGANGWGNKEREYYCRYGSNTPPCDPKFPNVYVANDGYLHIIARQPAAGVYTSARIKTQGLQSFQYGRIEARIKMPEGQGFWPAFWMLGSNVTRVDWPACGELDIMESVGKIPSTNVGSIHGTGFTGKRISTYYNLPDGTRFADAFHTFGIIWSPRSIDYYVDSPTNVFVTYTPSNLPNGAVWPFDAGKFFLILNLAVGGTWPGLPNTTSVFPQEMLVDYVRVYAEPTPHSSVNAAIKQ
jgi:beta-glucanase (GH16 family)